jgi:EmrB/QacA subfamily drug resistance transporter
MGLHHATNCWIVSCVKRPNGSSSSRWTVLMVLALAVFLITVDTTSVNVALPTLVTDLGATNRQLQWIVDAYNLLFAALVLAAGSIGDRRGRLGMLVSGLGVFGVGSLASALCTTPEALIGARALAGVGAAMVYPTTLSILTNVFTDRRERAAAIGVWSAISGMGVAFGPITGGWLLEHFAWGSVFWFKVPIAAGTAALALALVPTSRDPSVAPLDRAGLGLSAAALGSLTYTIIEAPGWGWASARTLTGLVVAALLILAFVWWERRAIPPMLDVGLFTTARFSASSATVAIVFFALFGFIFLITQYFQFLKGYGPFETGVRILPVALSIAAGSVVGTRIVIPLGTKAVVGAGMVMLTGAFAWISTVDVATSYTEIALQMVLLGTGLGLTSAPATEAIMGVVSRERAGIGSAVNDATREVGGTLGVAVIGSLFASIYGSALTDTVTGVPAGALASARDSVGAALATADQLRTAGAADLAGRLAEAARDAFLDGLTAGCLLASGVCLLGALIALLALPAQPSTSPEGAAPASIEPSAGAAES